MKASRRSSSGGASPKPEKGTPVMPVAEVLATPARARLKRLLKNLADHTTSAGLKDQAPSTVIPGPSQTALETRAAELCSTLSPKALPSCGNVRIPSDASFEVKEQRGSTIVLRVIGRRTDYCLTTASSSPNGKACYTMSNVQSCLPELQESLVMRPAKRMDWVRCLGEMAALCEEASRQRAQKLQLETVPPPLSLAYLADRIDIDDPLWGYQVRSRSKGHLQGFVTVTAFTCWTLDFEWTNSHPWSGMPAARMANAAITRRRFPARNRSGRPWDLEVQHEPHEAEEDETPSQIAALYDVPVATVVAINQPLYGQDFTAGCRLREGTVVHLIEDSEQECVVVTRGVTAVELAASLNVALADLLALNSKPSWAHQPKTRKIRAGERVVVRDRSMDEAVLEVHNDGVETVRALDSTARSLAERLQLQPRSGDADSGVVWHRVAELALLAGLGCGSWLLQLVLEELADTQQYDFCVLQATAAAVTFYEKHGFKRVGAVAKYVPAGGNKTSEKLMGYRHWTFCDDRRLAQQQTADPPSYMMALELPPAHRHRRCLALLQERCSEAWPRIVGTRGAPDMRANGGMGEVVHEGAEVVHTMVNGQEHIVIEYEVQTVLNKRTVAGHPEYLVRWVGFPPEETTWEPLSSLASAQEAIEEFEARSSKKRKRELSPQKPSKKPAKPLLATSHNTLCQSCGLGGELLCCDYCNLVYHLGCLQPRLTRVPPGSWACPECRAERAGEDSPVARASAPKAESEDRASTPRMNRAHWPSSEVKKRLCGQAHEKEGGQFGCMLVFGHKGPHEVGGRRRRESF